MTLLRAFGLVIDSALDVPGAVPVVLGAADVTIAAGEAVLDGPAKLSGPYRLAGDRLLFCAEGVARYLCIGGERIVVAAEPRADPARVSALLIATALPALLWMRGDWALHGCAALLPGRDSAIAFTAASGGGKSTLLAEVLRRGARMIADDVVRLAMTGDAPPHASGLSGGLFARDQADARVFHRVDLAAQCAGAPLTRLVVLDRSRDGPPRLERLGGIAALEALLAARHRPRVPLLLGDMAAHLAQSALLARRLGIYRCSVGMAGPAATIDILMQESDLWPTNSGSAATIG